MPWPARSTVRPSSSTCVRRSRSPPRSPARESELGPVDVLVNNAGYDEWAWFTDTDEELWDRVLAVNLRGVIAVTHAVLPGMQERRRGRIVNTASEAGRVGSSGSAVYSAAKAGVIGFTKTIAVENGRYGITCNAVAPGPIETPLLMAAPEQLGDVGKRIVDTMIGSTNLRRLGRSGRGGRRDRLPRVRRRVVRDGPVARRERRACQDLAHGEDPRGRPAGRVPERARGHRDRRQGAARRDARAHGRAAARGHELRARRRDPPAGRRPPRCCAAPTSRTTSR